MAANPQTKPTDLACESTAAIHTHHRRLLVLLSRQPESWYSFYRPAEGGRLSRSTHCREGTCADRAQSCILQSREWVDGSWVMGQKGHENRMGHTGHGSLGVDP